MREQTCFFTGHRDILKEQYPAIQRQIERETEGLIQKGVVYFGVGGAMGFDMLAAMTVIKLRHERYPNIRLVLILPCKDHDFGWPGEDREIFQKIAEQADKVLYTSEKYTHGCMYKRNRHMAEQSGFCICYFDRATGGTAYAVSYAQSVGVEIVNLAMTE